MNIHKYYFIVIILSRQLPNYQNDSTESAHLVSCIKNSLRHFVRAIAESPQNFINLFRLHHEEYVRSTIKMLTTFETDSRCWETERIHLASTGFAVPQDALLLTSSTTLSDVDYARERVTRTYQCDIVV